MEKVIEVKNHRVVCSDLMLMNFDDLMQGKHATLMYSDPPWGEGNLRYWQTLNKRMTGASVNEVNLVNFLKLIFKIADKYVSEIIWLEYGIGWRQLINDYCDRYGFIHLARIDSFYKSGSKLLPLDIHMISKKLIPVRAEYLRSFTGLTGYNTVINAIRPYAVPGEIIIDPCCGMGYTAQSAVDTGMIFYGCELNQKRLDKTIQRLQ